MTKKDILIIGGGIVGSVAAYYLAKSGRQVTLIDHGEGQATKAAAGIICPWLSQRRNQAWYRLTSQGAAFYQKLMADLQADGLSNLPYRQTGTLAFKDKPALLAKLEKTALKRREAAPQMGDISCYPDGVQALIPPLTSPQGAILASGGGRVDGGQLTADLQAVFEREGGQLLQGKAAPLDPHRVSLGGQILEADQLILAAGAWLPEVLRPLGYQVDVRPQKGQLLEVETDWETWSWPGCLLQGEADLLPFDSGRLVIGASHEDDQGYDLTVNPDKLAELQAAAASYLPDLADLPISRTRVGTRAYTPDYSPFYGALADAPHIRVVSGLGSSGLTSGPFIAWQLACQILNQPLDFDSSPYNPASYVRKV